MTFSRSFFSIPVAVATLVLLGACNSPVIVAKGSGGSGGTDGTTGTGTGSGTGASPGTGGSPNPDDEPCADVGGTC